MKVLIYSHNWAPFVGGIETLTMALANGFTERSKTHEGRNVGVTLVTRTPAGTMDDSSLPFRVVRLPGLRKLAQLIRSADLVHLAGPTLVPLALAVAFRKPTVVEHSGFQVICPNGQLFHEPTRTACPGYFMAKRYLECWKCNAQAGRARSLQMWALTFVRRWLCRQVTANVAPTHALKSLLRLPETFVIWHGVAEPGAPLPHAHRDPPTFVFLGRLVSTKGVHILLDAAHALQNKGLAFRVAVIGEGPERRHLEDKSQGLGLSGVIDFLGYLPKADLEQILQGSVAVVMPSLAGEVFGLVAAENMMRGCLMIVPDSGSLAEVVGETGLKFRPGDAEDLAVCMESVLRSPEWAADLGKRAQSRSREVFQEGRMVDEHLKLYRDMVR